MKSHTRRSSLNYSQDPPPCPRPVPALSTLPRGIRSYLPTPQPMAPDESNALTPSPKSAAKNIQVGNARNLRFRCRAPLLLFVILNSFEWINRGSLFLSSILAPRRPATPAQTLMCPVIQEDVQNPRYHEVPVSGIEGREELVSWIFLPPKKSGAENWSGYCQLDGTVTRF